MHVTLYRQDGATRVHIDASVTDDGDLQVAGHDIGEAPKKWWGHEDYEYVVTVRRQHKERLLQALRAAQSGGDASTASQEVAGKKTLFDRWFTKDKDRVLLNLIAAQFGDDASAVSRFRDFVQERSVPYEWFSWP